MEHRQSQLQMQAALLALALAVGACSPASEASKTEAAATAQTDAAVPAATTPPVTAPVSTSAKAAPDVAPAAAGPLQQATTGRFTVIGTEPFYEIKVDADGTATWADPELMETGGTIPTWQLVRAVGAGGQIVATATGLKLTVSDGPCSDGMSETVWPMTARVEREGREPLNGCAYVPWETSLTALIPAIDACLAGEPAGTLVANASRQPDGSVSMLLELPGESAVVRQACLIGSGGRVTKRAPVSEFELNAGGSAQFKRRRPGIDEANPGGECFEAPATTGRDGSVLGWMQPTESC